MNTTIKIPFYIRLFFTLVNLIGITYILYMGENILMPILLAFLFAVLLLPIVHFFNSKLHFPNVLSSTIAVIIFVSLILGIFAFISYEISDIASDFAEIKKNISVFMMLSRLSQFNRRHRAPVRRVNERFNHFQFLFQIIGNRRS